MKKQRLKGNEDWRKTCCKNWRGQWQGRYDEDIFNMCVRLSTHKILIKTLHENKDRKYKRSPVSFHS